MKCSVDGCDTKSRTKGFCGTHYSRFLRHGDPSTTFLDRNKVCAIDGCESKSLALDFCRKHYTRLLRHGDPLIVKKGGRKKGWRKKDV